MYYNLPPTNNFFTNHKGYKIHYREWLTNSNNFIFYFHGYNCNINRNIQDNFFKLIPQINMCAYDIQGHGFSEGETALVESTNDLIKDGLQFIQLMLKKHKINKYIIMGSSMGGSLAIELSKEINDNKLIGTILLAPAISLCGNNNQLLEHLLQNYISYYLPKQKFPNFLNYRVDPSKSINCHKLIQFTNNDKLTYKENIKFQTANTIISLGHSNLQNLHKIKPKITILHDINDQITSFKSSAQFCALTKSKLIPLHNQKHDLLANCPNIIKKITLKYFKL